MLRGCVVPRLVAIVIGAIMAGCASGPVADTASPTASSESSVSTDAVSREDATNHESAAIDLAANPTVIQTVLMDGLEHPWGLAWLPDGTLIITERPGRVRLIRDGQLSEPLAGVPAVFATGQGGLLDVSVHPDFETNQWVYFTYASGDRGANQTRVARARLQSDTLTNWEIIFEVNRAKEGGQHFGSRMTWLPDNTLLVSIGDGGTPPVELDGQLIRNQAQNLESHLGKIVRLNDDGSTPPDNPFVSTPNAAPRVWSYGHRNIQGLMYDPVSDRVWSTEHGARGGDELNAVMAGENYGSERSRPGMVDPLVVWTPAIAPSGLLVYQGDAFPQWQGDLFAGGLVSQDLRHVEVDAAGTVLSETTIAIGQRVRDVRQGPDGLIYVLTDEPNGRLIRLEPG